ncbi:MAG TPA: hypothetical protein VN282_23120 [Pyrinomonadaceae bacterium]|nr:hypothetical protein [Pyrinomonadaceae bacterium]
MSDYLWDKKGEPDAEVARLEALLGAFGHEPRTLALPAEATPEPRASGLLPFVSRLRASRLFAPAALAAAAALVVASVVVAFAFLRAQRTAARSAAEVTLSFPPGAKGKKAVDEATPAGVRAVEEKAEGEKVKVVAGSLPRPERRRKDVQVAAAPGRRQRQLPTVETAKGAGLTLEQMGTSYGASTLVQNTRLLAKEQLVYALRFTGAKLKDVQEKAVKDK